MSALKAGVARAVAVLLLLLFAAAGACFAEPPKVIKDPAEYNAYMAALAIADPAKKAAAMEDFVAQYPGSVVRLDALAQAMAAWQQAGNQAQVESAARRLLAADPGNVRALAIVTFLERAQATQGRHEALAALGGHAAEGLRALPRWQKPEGVSDADFARLRDQMTAIFQGAAGFAALQAKDYDAARAAYLKAVALDGGNLQDVYQLAVSELQMDPPDANGFWHVARALALAEAQHNAAGAQSIAAYGKARYARYHGSEDGWDAIVAQAAKQATPPASFAQQITSTAAALAVKAVKEHDPMTLSFSDWEYVLAWRDASPENRAAADTVWKAIQQKQQGAKLRIPVKVVGITKDGFLAAITEDHQKSNTPDLRVSLATPAPDLPGPGTAVDVIGVLDEYRPSPFQFHMKDAELPPKK